MRPGEPSENHQQPSSCLSVSVQYGLCIIHSVAAVREKNCSFNHRWILGFQFATSLSCCNSKVFPPSFSHATLAVFSPKVLKFILISGRNTCFFK